MKKVLIAVLIVILAGLLGTTIAFATDTNHVEYWEGLGYGTCEKIEFDGVQPRTYDMPQAPEGTEWTLLVLKAGTENRIVENPAYNMSYFGPDMKELSHIIQCYDEKEYEPCSETTEWIADPWSDWRSMFNGDEVRSRVYRKFDLQNQETVCARRVQLETRTPEGPDVDFEVAVDCEKWCAYLFIDGEPMGSECGTWKDLTTDESFVFTQFVGDAMYSVFILEPQDCEECISEYVFYWTDGYCMIRQRGGPIGGQQRPFIPMIYAYCGCEYQWGDWTGHYADSCADDGSEYTYWNEIPQFCGAQVCE